MERPISGQDEKPALDNLPDGPDPHAEAETVRKLLYQIDTSTEESRRRTMRAQFDALLGRDAVPVDEGEIDSLFATIYNEVASYLDANDEQFGDVDLERLSEFLHARFLGASKVLGPANRRFTLKFFKGIVQRDPGSNVIVSPMSIAIALATLNCGAASKTREAITGLLELIGVEQETINRAYKALLTRVNNLDPQISLSTSTSIEHGSNTAITPSFRETVQNYYRADVSELGAGENLLLINKIDFNGKWTTPFTKRRLRLIFFMADGTRKACNYMPSPEQEWDYFQHEKFQLIRLPYGKGAISMYVLVPGTNSSLSEIVDNYLTAENWQSWMSDLTRKKGEIRLPPFEIDFNIDLRASLKSLGLGIVFEPGQADFSGLCASPAYVSRATHRAHIEVDEEGTRASAETLMEISIGIPSEEPFHMIANRPFLCVIQDDLTGAPLFIGQIIDPDPTSTTSWEQEERDTLQNVLDLIVVCMKAHRTFGESLGVVYEVIESQLAYAIGRVIQEEVLGKPLAVGLRDMAERLANPDVTEVFEAITGAEQTEASLFEAVRAQAARFRQKYPET